MQFIEPRMLKTVRNLVAPQGTYVLTAPGRDVEQSVADGETQRLRQLFRREDAPAVPIDYQNVSIRLLQKRGVSERQWVGRLEDTRPEDAVLLVVLDPISHDDADQAVHFCFPVQPEGCSPM